MAYEVGTLPLLAGNHAGAGGSAGPLCSQPLRVAQRPPGIRPLGVEAGPEPSAPESQGTGSPPGRAVVRDGPGLRRLQPSARGTAPAQGLSPQLTATRARSGTRRLRLPA